MALRSAGAALAFSIAGCLGGAPAQRRTVEMADDLTFDPKVVSIGKGGTVSWKNVGSIEHTVTAYQDHIPDRSAYFASGGFDAERTARQNLGRGLIPGGQTFEHTFEHTGRFGYFCIPHETAGMTGTVLVE